MLVIRVGYHALVNCEDDDGSIPSPTTRSPTITHPDDAKILRKAAVAAAWILHTSLPWMSSCPDPNLRGRGGGIDNVGPWWHDPVGGREPQSLQTGQDKVHENLSCMSD